MREEKREHKRIEELGGEAAGMVLREGMSEGRGIREAINRG